MRACLCDRCESRRAYAAGFSFFFFWLLVSSFLLLSDWCELPVFFFLGVSEGSEVCRRFDGEGSSRCVAWVRQFGGCCGAESSFSSLLWKILAIAALETGRRRRRASFSHAPSLVLSVASALRRERTGCLRWLWHAPSSFLFVCILLLAALFHLCGGISNSTLNSFHILRIHFLFWALVAAAHHVCAGFPSRKIPFLRSE